MRHLIFVCFSLFLTIGAHAQTVCLGENCSPSPLESPKLADTSLSGTTNLSGKDGRRRDSTCATWPCDVELKGTQISLSKLNEALMDRLTEALDLQSHPELSAANNFRFGGSICRLHYLVNISSCDAVQELELREFLSESDELWLELEPYFENNDGPVSIPLELIERAHNLTLRYQTIQSEHSACRAQAELERAQCNSGN